MERNMGEDKKVWRGIEREKSKKKWKRGGEG